MSVVTRPFTGFYRSFSNDRPSRKAPVRLSESDRVLDEPMKAAAYESLPDEIDDTFTLGTELSAELVEAPRVDISVEPATTSEETWAPLEVEKTLGQLMTEARKSRGISREEAADHTSIPAYYIRMIESDCYDAIPDQLYLLPFFQRYAIFLKIDAQQVVARFIRNFEKAENEIAVPAPAQHKASFTDFLRKWRGSLEAATVVGIILLLVCWEVGRIRAANHHDSSLSSVAAVSTATKSVPSIPASNAAPAIVAPASVPPQQAAVSSAVPAKPVVSSAPPAAADQIAATPQTSIRSRHHTRIHRLIHHLRHLKHGVS